MIKSLLLILIGLFSTSSHAKHELLQHLENIYNNAIELQNLNVNNDAFNKKVNDFYLHYFLNGKNIFKQAADNWEVKYDCGTLSLKKSCFTEVFKTNIKINDKTACVNLYGINKRDETLILQDTTLFIKKNNTWKIVGNRLAQSNVTMLVYGLLNGDKASESFTNRCLTKDKLLNREENKTNSFDNYYHKK